MKSVVPHPFRALARLPLPALSSWLLCLAQPTSVQAAVTHLYFGLNELEFRMDFVDIGNPGNVADDTGAPNPVGAVPYTFLIGKYEVSEKMVTIANTLGNLNISLDSRYEDKPATSVSWNEAARFVNWLNTSTGHSPAYKFAAQPGEFGYSPNTGFELWSNADPGYNPDNPFRNANALYFLPSADEWYKAAYFDPEKTGGPGYWNYPNGKNSAPNVTSGSQSPNSAVYNQPVTQGPADIDAAGSPSPYGTIAQGGNVYEWNETAFDGVNDLSTESRVVRGGAYNSSANFLASNLRNLGGPTASAGNIGFRVAAMVMNPTPVPEPATFATVTGILAAGFAFWRRIKRPR